ncbi:MAG TPA: DUF2334 domain-containing protein [Acidobacteriota bacterium]|nr:DUF2334 domain-containing protein [Acidobacteriota bacterium]
MSLIPRFKSACKTCPAGPRTAEGEDRTGNCAWRLRRAAGVVMILLPSSMWGISASKPAPVPPADVLILHDSLPGPIPAGIVDGNNILDLLGHFGLKGQIASLEEYKTGQINRHRFVIMLAVDDRKVNYPHSLIADVRNSSVPVLWIGRHLYDLVSDAQFTKKIGFRLSGPGLAHGAQSVVYKEKELFKNDPFLFPIEILDSGKVQVLATAKNGGGQSRPYMVRSGSFWYIADTPFGFAAEGDRYLAFCDMLHDFFGIPHQEERKALVRLEDVSVEEEPENLTKIADFLAERKIPFQVSLIPIFKDPENKEEIYLSDRPEFVRAIHYMMSKGGVIVMHGSTHQYRGKSGDDFEFWDELGSKTIQGDSPALVEAKLRAALEECFKNGIYPLSWETPHYVASTVDYQTIAKYFNSSYERVCSLDRADTGHFFPYTSVDRFGRFIIPEPLGFIDGEKPDPDALVSNAERLQVVRDGIASFFFHPFLDIKYLEQCIDGIEKLGFKFVSIGDYDLRVQMDDRLVQSYTGSIQLPVHGRYLHRFMLHDDGRKTSESYSQRPLDTVVRDPGVVPPDAILVMEGVTEIVTEKLPSPPSRWATFWTWVQKKFERRIPGAYLLRQPQALILWDDALTRGDWNNQKSYESALSAFGFRVSILKWRDFGKSALDQETVLIVPRAVVSQLSPKQVQSVQEFVRDGGRLVLDSPSSLSEMLGIQTEKRYIKIHRVQDMLYKSTDNGSRRATWNPPVDVTRFLIRNPLDIYARDEASQMPIAVLTGYEHGRILFLGARLDPISQLGYTRFPYFVHYVMKGFGLRMPIQRAQLELYFDPGADTRPIDRLVEDWREKGVRAIYAAAWHFWPSWSYNYAHLLDVCHKNGILVYAWFELPHVSAKFWEDHAEWRAKTATGADGEVGWRMHMDLDIPECRDAVYAFVDDLLRTYPWDGVNLAELNYDSDNGPENPSKYLPMGAPTRADFKRTGGFDPILLFKQDSPYYWKENHGALKKFDDYRSQRVLAWHRALLGRIMPLAQERDMEVIVTMLDSLHSSTLTRDTGVDSHLIVSLMDQYPFTLQVEDPSHLWTESPDRYSGFTNTYLGLVHDRRRLMFDINVVNRDVTNSHSPTQLCVGTELAHALIAASTACGRAAIYSTASMPFEDLVMLSTVLAHNAHVERRWNAWVTHSDRSVQVATPGDWQSFRVDDKVWPGWGENEMVIPGGTHSITEVKPKWTLVDTSVLDIRLVRFAGNLETLIPTDRGLEFSYDSYMRTLALFNHQPFGIIIDGQPWWEKPIPFGGFWSVRLPRGRHRVEIVADSTASVILDTASLYSSTLIVIFGGVACGLMVLIYLAILARRAIGRAVNRSESDLSQVPRA